MIGRLLYPPPPFLWGSHRRSPPRRLRPDQQHRQARPHMQTSDAGNSGLHAPARPIAIVEPATNGGVNIISAARRRSSRSSSRARAASGWSNVGARCRAGRWNAPWPTMRIAAGVQRGRGQSRPRYSSSPTSSRPTAIRAQQCRRGGGRAGRSVRRRRQLHRRARRGINVKRARQCHAVGSTPALPRRRPGRRLCPQEGHSGARRGRGWWGASPRRAPAATRIPKSARSSCWLSRRLHQAGTQLGGLRPMRRCGLRALGIASKNWGAAATAAPFS